MTAQATTAVSLALVTGAAGFVGRRVCAALAQAGMPLLAVDRVAPPLDALRDSLPDVPCETAVVDLLDAARVLALVEHRPDITHLVHLAAPVPGSTARSARLLADGMTATLNLLPLLEAVPLRHITFLSSVAVYGFGHEEPVSEASPVQVGVDPYATMKWLGEQTLGWAAAAREATLAVLRPAQVYGPGEPHGLGLTRMVRTALAGDPIVLNNGGGDVRDLIFVDDLARAVALATARGFAGTVNISGGTGFTIYRLAEAILRAADRSVALQVLPADRPTTRQVYLNRQARERLGFTPDVALDDGVARVVAHGRARQER